MADNDSVPATRRLTEYVVITQHIIGSSGRWETIFRHDGKTFAKRTDAIKHGWRTLGHDDFNIGTVKAGRLVAFGWGDWNFGDPGHGDDEPHGGYDLSQIQQALVLTGGAS